MVKPGSNQCGLAPQVFLLIPFYFSKIRLFLWKALKYFARVLQSYSTQKALQNQHFDFNSIWRYRVLIYQKVCFIQKDSFAIYLNNGTLGTFVTHQGVGLWQLPSKGIFGIFCNFPLFMSSQVPKISQKWPCTVTVIAERPDKLQRFPRFHCRDKWQSYLFL